MSLRSPALAAGLFSTSITWEALLSGVLNKVARTHTPAHTRTHTHAHAHTHGIKQGGQMSGAYFASEGRQGMEVQQRYRVEGGSGQERCARGSGNGERQEGEGPEGERERRLGRQKPRPVGEGDSAWCPRDMSGAV